MAQGESVQSKVLAARLALFFALWLIVAGVSVKTLPVGLAAAAGALWISLKLAPPGGLRPDWLALALLLGGTLRGSVVAGFDVARRALSPRLDLNPGVVDCSLTLAPGLARDAFLLHQSLMPGTLPIGAQGQRVPVHALDVSQPVAARLAADEALFKKAIGHE
jgi:multicomponent Na+:H+ antiporter subunit E